MIMRQTKTEIQELKRKAADTICGIAKELGRHRDTPGDERRYRAVLDAWNQVRHYPLTRSWLHMEIARHLDFESRESVWRIIKSYQLIQEGEPDRKSMGGYYRTWQRILNAKEESHAVEKN